MGNSHPEKTNVDQGEAEIDIGFREKWQFPVLPSTAVNNYSVILNVN